MRLTEITLQDLASAGVFQPAYGLLLDLAHTLARQVEFLTNLLQRHRVAAAQPEIQPVGIETGIDAVQRMPKPLNLYQIWRL